MDSELSLSRYAGDEIAEAAPTFKETCGTLIESLYMDDSTLK